MPQPFDIKTDNAHIRIGYRSPGLSKTLNADQKMQLCQELGMGIIEPQIVDREFANDQAVKDYRKAADEHGIEITSAGILLPYSDPAASQQCESGAAHALDVADMLGVDYLFTLVHYPPDGIVHRDSWQLTRDRLHAFVDKAAARHIRVGLEPEWFLGTRERVVKMIEAVGHPNFQLINFDPCNFYTSGSDPLDVVRYHSDIIVNGHIKDGYFQTNKHGESAIGEGELDWAAIFQAMIEAGGEYTMHLEHLGSADEVRKASAVIRDVIEKLPVLA